MEFEADPDRPRQSMIAFYRNDISKSPRVLTEDEDIKILVVRRRVKWTTGNISGGFRNRARFLAGVGVRQIGGPSRLLHQPIISVQIARLGSNERDQQIKMSCSFCALKTCLFLKVYGM